MAVQGHLQVELADVIESYCWEQGQRKFTNGDINEFTSGWHTLRQ